MPSNLFDKNCLSLFVNIFEIFDNVLNDSSINANSVANNTTLVFDFNKDITLGIESFISPNDLKISCVKSILLINSCK